MHAGFLKPAREEPIAKQPEPVEENVVQYCPLTLTLGFRDVGPLVGVSKRTTAEETHPSLLRLTPICDIGRVRDRMQRRI